MIGQPSDTLIATLGYQSKSPPSLPSSYDMLKILIRVPSLLRSLQSVDAWHPLMKENMEMIAEDKIQFPERNISK